VKSVDCLQIFTLPPWMQTKRTMNWVNARASIKFLRL